MPVCVQMWMLAITFFGEASQKLDGLWNCLQWREMLGVSTLGNLAMWHWGSNNLPLNMFLLLKLHRFMSFFLSSLIFSLFFLYLIFTFKGRSERQRHCVKNRSPPSQRGAGEELSGSTWLNMSVSSLYQPMRYIPTLIPGRLLVKWTPYSLCSQLMIKWLHDKL